MEPSRKPVPGTTAAFVAWDGDDERGHPAGAGMYFYELRTEARRLSGRAVVLR
ncbi:MAG: hypothetical protein HZC42_04025 [Candidatus Eisenbacteria bacterium]|nr:hypothetical protein [Candidatus Eisenbacteria bacterium]